MAEDGLVLRIADLRKALDDVLRSVEAQFGGEVVLPGDHYWHLPVDAAFDMGREPADLTVGQLADDLGELEAGSTSDSAALWHDLAHLGGLLRAIEKLALP